MLHRIDELLAARADFAFETTLSSKSYVNIVKEAKELGYFVTLVFFYLDSVDLAKERVQLRVIEGGHNIPEEVIERRYHQGLKNLFEKFISIVDHWMIFNNSNNTGLLISKGGNKEQSEIYNEQNWQNLTKVYGQYT